jgi:ATP-dependent Lhr-like helicase
MPRSSPSASRALARFHPAVREWFAASFDAPTPPQARGWPAIARGESTLILAPTGTGKTLAAFLWCLERLMFEPVPPPRRRCRVVYVSPLKALAVDVERNLRAPLAGIANRAQERSDALHVPRVTVRTGDTPAAERARFQRDPADILITTPESLYLVLTSQAAAALRGVDTVIVDEIHALVPTKRGAHLALSLERLERLAGRPLQRIGLSATQRPLDEVARFLGGAQPPRPPRAVGRRAARRTRAAGAAAEAEVHAEFTGGRAAEFRPVTVVDAGGRKPLELSIEVPVEDMARLGEPIDIPSGPASHGPVRASIWVSIYPRLLELIRAHRTTLLFVNSRRIAERLAAALNELAGETLVRSHHGSLARPQRIEVEDRLKAGLLRGLVATSSLELGIDMGAIDLVIQIEAPPSVASGMQRIGRGGHRIDLPSRGIIFPKYRGDLVACAAVTHAMHEGRVEATRYPRNPLDVLAQQIVAMAAMETWDVDALYGAVRGAAPFADLGRAAFEGVLDMLAGRYPSDAFAELRPRVTWDRVANSLVAREGAKRVAVVNGGTIPDRGLYGVFLAGAGPGGARVGELDEEMVFESRVGETFLLGATSWRIEEITHDRVLVSPAPGEPGKMPFWKGDAAGRPLELGLAIGALVRSLRTMPRAAAETRLAHDHDLDRRAAANLLDYLADQSAAAGAVPDDRTLVIERVRDELGDWRVCVLSPLGGRVHAPWAMAVIAKVRAETGMDVEVMWTDDGFVVRFPETDAAPDPRLLLPEPGELEALVLRQLGATSMFAARFRENAARALLLPRRRPGGRTPLWQQRKRAADLLAVAARFGSFPIVLETYRECLRDVFDLPALDTVLRLIAQRSIHVAVVDAPVPSPFASALLFGYVANYLYDGDAPLAERRAQALSIDQAQLRELLGESELRELLDEDAIAAVEREVQRLAPEHHARSADGVHDLLLRLGDLSHAELVQRATVDDLPAVTAALVSARRVLEVALAGERRLVPVEYAARYRDALGVPLPPGLPEAFLAPVADAPGDLARRFARTHGPFAADTFARRYGLTPARATAILHAQVADGRLAEGAFRPGGSGREWCDTEILARIRRRSLARLRREIEPVEPAVLARLVTTWQGVTRPRRGVDALLDTVENLQGAAIPASILEHDVLPARVDPWRPGDLDALLAGGEIVWRGVEPLGESDGRVALYLTDHLSKLVAPAGAPGSLTPRAAAVLEYLEHHGASFFTAIHDGTGGGYPGDAVDALWDLVWAGLVTNDGLHALRAFIARPERARRRTVRTGQPAWRSRRLVPPSAQGRWSTIASWATATVSATERAAALAQQLLSRYGIVTREVASAESLTGGFSAVYDVLKLMEEAGRIRRGLFVGGVGAAQFAMPAALDVLRSLREDPAQPEVVTLAAADPANPYGTLLRWPERRGGGSQRELQNGNSAEPSDGGPQLRRTVGAHVVLVDGRLAVYVARGGRSLASFLPDEEPQRGRAGAAVANALIALALRPGAAGLLVETIDGMPALRHPLAAWMLGAGFASSPHGLHPAPGPPGAPSPVLERSARGA